MNSGYRILIVEDSAIQAEMLRRLLADAGYSVNVAGNGLEGLEAAKKQKPDLVLSDIMMPVMNGYEMCRKLKDGKEMKDVPVILLTQLTETEEVIKGLESGADHYVTKPVDEQFLLSKIEVVLKKPKLYRNDPAQKCIIFDYDGKRFQVRSGRTQTLSYLISTYEDALLKNRSLELLQAQLAGMNAELERKVEERTASLVKEIEERKRTEEALRVSEERFRAIFDNATDGILLADMENKKFFTGNKMICEMLGYTLDEIRNLGVTEIHPQEDLSYVVDQFERQAKGEFTLAKDIPVKRKDGTVFFADINAYPLRLGGKEYLAGAFRDITERKRLEEAFQAQSRRSEAFFEHTITPFVFLDKDFNFIRVNKAYADAGKRDISEFPGHNHFEFYPSDAREIFEEVVRTRTAFQTFACPFIYADHPEGGVTFWDWTLVPMLDNKGEIEFLVLSLVDVTERRRSEIMMKNILESIDEGIIILDPEYRIISANRAYCEQVKSPECDIIGRHCHEVSHHLDKPCFLADEECAAMRTFKTGAPHMAIHTHYDKDNNPMYIETKAFPMTDASGKIITVIESLNNITERRSLEEQLRHAQKMEAVGTLAGGVAHDFNNLLNVIIGYGGLMQLKMKPDDPLLPQLKEILAAGDRAAHLTKGLLAFCRKQVMEIRTIGLNEVIEGFRKMLARIVGEDIELRTTLSEQKLIIRADIVQIEQVLMNLAANARDAMRKGGCLAIETRPLKIDKKFMKSHGYGEPGEYALLTVSDTGAGMDEKTRERIFEPFFTTREPGKGTGLGLSIVYGIVKQHKGLINCYSEPGKGTTFRIYLPLAKAAADMVAEAEELIPKGGTETILVAEDDAGVRIFMKTTLEAFGYRIIEAVDGADAVNKFRENRDSVHLLLFDLIMPRENGKDAYEDIRGIRPDIKVIFASGYAADIIQKFGIEEGVEFISKPVSPNELLRKVREALDS